MTRRPTAASPRGTILIVTMMILIVITTMVLVFARAMRIEAMATANEQAAAQARAIAQGAALAVMQLQDNIPGDAVKIGGGAFWVIRPNYDLEAGDEQEYAWGLTDESAKLNINVATQEVLERLPGMTQDMAAAIIDWRDADSEMTDYGAESDHYLMLANPYAAKNAPFETVEELLLLRDFTPLQVYGEDANRNGILDPNEDDGDEAFPPDNGDGRIDRGLIDFVTVYSAEPEGDTRLINVNGDEGGGGGGGGGVPGGGGGSGGGNNNGGGRSGNGGGGNGGAGGGGGGGDNDAQAIREALAEVLPEERAEELANAIIADRPYDNMIDLFYESKMTVEEFAAASKKLTTGGNSEGLINISTAPREVLLTLPELDEGDVDSLIDYRRANATAPEIGDSAAEGEEEMIADPLDGIAWITEVLDRETAMAIGGLITATSFQRSADIVAVAPGGRAFERYRLVFDTTDSRVLLWQRLTHLGCPLSPEIMAQIRAGAEISDLAQTTDRGDF